MSRASWIRGVVCIGLTSLVLVVPTGCSEQRSVVRGSVSLKGKPLTFGIVRIHGPGNRITTAGVREDGSFALTDVFPGEVRVSVVDDKAESGMHAPPNVPLPPGGARPADAKRPPIPIKYQDPDTSGLVYTIPPRVKSLDLAINLD